MADEESPLLKETSQTTGLHEGTEGGARVEDTQKVVIENPSNINDLVQYLDTSLRHDQFQSIQLGCQCSSALGISVGQIGGDGANNSFSDLYTAMERNWTKKSVQGVLRFMLERVSYDMTGLEWLPKFDKATIGDDAARKLDMFLSLASMITSMKEEEYKRFRNQLIRQDGATDDHKNILDEYSADNINCRCHLLKLLHERGQFNIDDVNIVFHLLDKSGCSTYRTEIVEYCNRYGLQVPKESKQSCLLSCVITTIVILCIASFFTSFALTAVTLTQYNNLNKTSPYSATYLVGANTIVQIGDCLDPNLIDRVNVTAVRSETGIGSNNTAIYAVQESDIRSEMMYLPNQNARTLNAQDSRPVAVSYFNYTNPLYTAGRGGTMNYTVSLINNNVTRVSCALRLIVFDSVSDYFNYVHESRDPLHLPPNFYTNTSCVGQNGTYNFTFELRANTFFYIVASHVAGANFSVNASGNISRYSRDILSHSMSLCKPLTFSSPTCTFPLNQEKNSVKGKECLFGVSTNPAQGNVIAATIPQTYKSYKVKYIVPTGVVGFIFILFFCICCILCYIKNVIQKSRSAL